jgi:transposase
LRLLARSAYWTRLKEWRAVATRYEKTARSFLGMLCLAGTIDWLKAANANSPVRRSAAAT